ncbi:MAG: alpha/beta hydrolase [Bryobacteraceae bacterium]
MRVSPYVGWPLAVASGYGMLCFWASRSLYYPLKYPQGYWNLQTESGASDVWLRSSDGVRIHAWWICPPAARVATLFLHGNGGNLTHRVGHMQAITAAGSALLILDYRGYGKSDGWPTERGLYRDADAGYRHLIEAGYRPGSIVLHGESLGTAVAVDLAARHECGGVILEAPLTSAREVASRVLPLLGPAITWGFDSASKIPRVCAPLLVIHGTRDEVIPFELGQALFAAAREPKSFWAVEGSGHNDIVETAGDGYRRRLAEFYAALGGSK